jgi:hypothetical protein
MSLPDMAAIAEDPNAGTCRHPNVAHGEEDQQGQVVKLASVARDGCEPWGLPLPRRVGTTPRDSKEKSASPPPNASCRRRPGATRTWHGSPPSPSKTGSRSSALQARPPDTDEQPHPARPLTHNERAPSHIEENAPAARQVASGGPNPSRLKQARLGKRSRSTPQAARRACRGYLEVCPRHGC